ncbi:uncharacterized protein Tco025E_02436 [Trypanosoma conorhini]|uniref:Uncharacterized protein n=1 Tax=Trypanosoma conorhini TaxID=83891 RepID=A0A3R7N354_9TRYP|nr:uncharacterized protein Tco025E_02436 [Trypanosoma conorhini]RNF24677.1 hypothetical protein Tco025E_02436 [Trypanosoma conorhini]
MLSGISPGASSPLDLCIWAPVMPGTKVPTSQKTQDEFSASPCLGLTVSGVSELTLSSSFYGATQPSSPLLLNAEANDSGSVKAGEKSHSLKHGGGGGGVCNTPSDTSFIEALGQPASGPPRPEEAVQLSPHDVVRCAEHHKERTVQNMLRVVNRAGERVWVCRPDVACRMRKCGRALCRGARFKEPCPNAFPNMTSIPGATVTTMQAPRLVFATPHIDDHTAASSGVTRCRIGDCGAFVATPLALTASPALTQLQFLRRTVHGDPMFWVPVSPLPPAFYHAAPWVGGVGGAPCAGAPPQFPVPPNFTWVSSPVSR